MAEKYRAAEITAWLTEHDNTDATTARRAGRAVAGAWNRQEFYASATYPALVALLRAGVNRRRMWTGWPGGWRGRSGRTCTTSRPGIPGPTGERRSAHDE